MSEWVHGTVVHLLRFYGDGKKLKDDVKDKKSARTCCSNEVKSMRTLKMKYMIT